jgi:hypothetical protein
LLKFFFVKMNQETATTTSLDKSHLKNNAPTLTISTGKNPQKEDTMTSKSLIQHAYTHLTSATTTVSEMSRNEEMTEEEEAFDETRIKTPGKFDSKTASPLGKSGLSLSQTLSPTLDAHALTISQSQEELPAPVTKRLEKKPNRPHKNRTKSSNNTPNSSSLSTEFPKLTSPLKSSSLPRSVFSVDDFVRRDPNCLCQQIINEDNPKLCLVCNGYIPCIGK